MTIFEYLLFLRIQNSLIFLKEGESITRTAGLVGFSSPAYYGQIFKRYMKCTPKEYRDSMIAWKYKKMNFGYSILMIMCYTKQVWRRTEVAVTGLTRNQFTGFAPVRGFESLRLRLFIMWETPVFIGVSRSFLSLKIVRFSWELLRTFFYDARIEFNCSICCSFRVVL